MDEPHDFSLGDELEPHLSEVARAHGYPAPSDTARLGPMLAKLSEVYNTTDGKEAANLLPVRLAFSFPRDVPKGHAAVRELVATGALLPRADRPLRLLDVGAGLGAMTFGIVRALSRAAVTQGLASFAVDATWMDTDRAAMELGLELVRRALPDAATGPRVSVKLEKGTAAAAARTKGPFDVIVCGQVMSEMDAETAPAERIAHHATWLVDLSRLLSPEGSLVIVEPALASRTRHLHAVRDAVLAGKKLGVFAPCLHQQACPALASAHDWCHEDLPTDLPPFLVPLARSAGLRWQGLTFSYLILRKDGRTLREASARPLRVTSSLLRTKGKTELFLCGEHADGIGRGKARLLDRERTAPNAAFAEAERGDLLSFEPALASGGRLGTEMNVECTRYR